MQETAGLPTLSVPYQAAQSPRIRVTANYGRTLGDDCIRLNRALGIDLLPWQQDIVRDWLAVDERGQFIHRRNGISVPRQSGKSFLTIAVVNYLVLVLHFRVAFTAHNYSTVGDIFDRFKRLYGYKAKDTNAANKELNALVKNVRGATSRECIELQHVATSEGEYDPCVSFSTRTDSSLRGQSFDCLICDECQELQPSQLSSLLPTTNAGACSNPLNIFLGTPETPASRGEVFGHIRTDALSGEATDISWNEWSVEDVGDVRDVARWYETNPSLGRLSNESSLRAAVGSMAPFDFAQEYLGYWSQQQVNSVIDAAEWNSRATATPPSEGLKCFAVKFSPDGSSGCLSVALKPSEGIPHIEVVEARSMSGGVAWFADWLEARKGDTAQIVVDGMANAQPLVDELIRRGLPAKMIWKPRSADMAAACSDLLNAVREGKVTHFDQPGLNDSALKARKRPIGSGGGWGFADNGCDSTLIESCALAYWGAMNTKRNPKRKQRIGF